MMLCPLKNYLTFYTEGLLGTFLPASMPVSLCVHFQGGALWVLRFSLGYLPLKCRLTVFPQGEFLSDDTG